MKNDKLRQANKAAYIAQGIITAQSRIQTYPEPFRGISSVFISHEAQRLNREIPSKVFRLDKPAIDKRRARKYFRQRNKNLGPIISVVGAGHELANTIGQITITKKNRAPNKKIFKARREDKNLSAH